MIRIMLADDHPIVRQGLRTLLEGSCRCTVVGEATDGLTALQLVMDLRPDIAILDLQMPDLGGLEVARRIVEGALDTRVIILSMHGDEPFVQEALRNGALGYVLKGAATSDLVTAVQTVMTGKRFLSAALTERVLDAYAQQARVATEPLDRYDLLTNREREVLQLAAQGMSYAEIGERLTISPRTAETHRGNALRKLGLKDQTELIRYALGRGLLAP
ncbi:MAG: response regulator transcription factor [Thermomicrobiales bacterium]